MNRVGLDGRLASIVTRRVGPRAMATAMLAAALSPFACGCGGHDAAPKSTHTPTSYVRPSADQILSRLVENYQRAEAYFDRAEICLEYEIDGRSHADCVPFAVAWRRPDTLHVRAYQAEIHCEGQRLVARLRDELTGDIDNQIVDRPVASPLSLDGVLDDRLLSDTITEGLGRLPIQLELLLGDQPLAGFLRTDAKRELLDDKPLGGHDCHRLRVTAEEGPFVLWIDRASYMLRRLEYPTSMATVRLPVDSRPDNVRLVATFHDAQFRSEGDLTDLATDPRSPAHRSPAFDVGSDMKRVVRFVRPPQPLATNLLGETPRSFAFSSLEGPSVDSSSWQGRLTVLQWFVDHPACRASMTQLEQVRQAYAESEDVQFLGVCVEPANVSPDAIGSLTEEWGVTMPIVRDLSAVGRDVFAIEGLPALVVLDRRGRVQVFEVSYNPRLAEQLPKAIDELRSDGDLAAQVLAQVHNDTVEYRRLLAASSHRPDVGTIKGDGGGVDTGDNQFLEDDILWKRPQTGIGNLAAWGEGRQDQFVGIVDGRVLAQWNAAGSEVARHELRLPIGERLTMIRTHGSGIAAAARGGTACYEMESTDSTRAGQALVARSMPFDGVLDLAWQPQPEAGPMRLWVGTFAPGPTLIRCGEGEMAHGSVPYAQSMTIGHRWRIDDDPIGRAIPPNRSAAQTAEATAEGTAQDSSSLNDTGESILVADAGGRLTRVEADGSETPAPRHLPQGVFHITRAPIGQTAKDQPQYLGLSYSTDGARIAAGLDDQLRVRWQVKLVIQEAAQPVELAAAGSSDSATYWIVSLGGDGIAILSDEGEVTGNWHFGAQVTGYVSIDSPDGPVVIVATTEGLVALKAPGAARPRSTR